MKRVERLKPWWTRPAVSRSPKLHCERPNFSEIGAFNLIKSSTSFDTFSHWALLATARTAPARISAPGAECGPDGTICDHSRLIVNGGAYEDGHDGDTRG